MRHHGAAGAPNDLASSPVDYRLAIARRYLVSRKRLTLISTITGVSVAGVTLGVAALIVVLSVMNGFFSFVRDLLVSLDPHVRIVSVESRGLAQADADSLRVLTLGLDGVVQAAAYVEGRALLVHRGGDSRRVLTVRGVVPEALRAGSDVTQHVTMGRFDVSRRALPREDRFDSSAPSTGPPGIVLGLSLAQRDGLLPAGGNREASTVTLLSAAGVERMLTAPFASSGGSRFEVRGVFQLQDTYDASHVFVGLPEAQRLFRMTGRVSGVELRLADLETASAVKAALEERLDPARYTVSTWYDLQRSLYDTMRLEKWAASLILILIVVVAAFNIVGSLTMVVIEKRRDVGVLQAMGATPRDIRAIFLAEGLLIGVLGTGLGLVLGLGLALAQQHFGLVPLAEAESFMLDAYPVQIAPLDVALVCFVSLALCVGAAVYPARRAAAVQPAHAVQMDG